MGGRYPTKLTRRQKDEIRAIAAITKAGRPLYGYAYISCLYGVSGSRIHQIARRRAGKMPWYNKRW